MIKLSQKQIKSYRSNLARNYRTYERHYEKASKIKNVYIGEQLSKKAYFNRYLEFKAKGVKFSTKALVQPLISTESIKAIGKWLGYDEDQFIGVFFSKSVAEQKQLIGEYLHNHTLEQQADDDFEYEGILIEAPGIDEVAAALAENEKFRESLRKG